MRSVAVPGRVQVGGVRDEGVVRRLHRAAAVGAVVRRRVAGQEGSQDLLGAAARFPPPSQVAVFPLTVVFITMAVLPL